MKCYKVYKIIVGFYIFTFPLHSLCMSKEQEAEQLKQQIAELQKKKKPQVNNQVVQPATSNNQQQNIVKQAPKQQLPKISAPVLTEAAQESPFSSLGKKFTMGLNALGKSLNKDQQNNYILDPKNKELYQQINNQTSIFQSLEQMQKTLVSSDENCISKIYNRGYYTDAEINRILSDPASYAVYNSTFETNLTHLKHIIDANPTPEQSVINPQLYILAQKYIELCNTAVAEKLTQIQSMLNQSNDISDNSN